MVFLLTYKTYVWYGYISHRWKTMTTQKTETLPKWHLSRKQLTMTTHFSLFLFLSNLFLHLFLLEKNTLPKDRLTSVLSRWLIQVDWRVNSDFFSNSYATQKGSSDRPTYNEYPVGRLSADYLFMYRSSGHSQLWVPFGKWSLYLALSLQSLILLEYFVACIICKIPV